MKNRWKRLTEKVNRTRSKPFFVKMRKSLAYNMVKAFACVFVFVLAFYLIIPKEAHIDLTTNEITRINQIDSRYICADLTFEESGFSITDFDHIVICLGSSTIDSNGDVQYQPKLIHVTENATASVAEEISVRSEHNMPYSVSIASFELSRYWFMNESSRFMIGMPTYSSNIEFSDDFSITSHENLVFKFSDGLDAYLYSENEQPVKINELVLSSANSYALNLNCVRILGHASVLVNNTSNESADVIFNNVCSMDGIASGDVAFYYASDETRLTIRNQSFVVKDDSSSLSSHLEVDHDSVKSFFINGMVQKAEISGSSLFPTFLNWFSDNAYLAASTLLTTVFGAISLFYTNRKQE